LFLLLIHGKRKGEEIFFFSSRKKRLGKGKRKILKYICLIVLWKMGNILDFEEYGVGWTHNIPKEGIGRAENFHGYWLHI